MSLSIAKIIALSKAGFDENTITALNMLNQPQQMPLVNQPHQTPLGNQPQQANAPLLDPNLSGTQAGALTTDQSAYIKALQDLNFRLATGQQLTQQQTTEDILAGIINPPLNNGGENNGR